MTRAWERADEARALGDRARVGLLGRSRRCERLSSCTVASKKPEQAARSVRAGRGTTRGRTSWRHRMHWPRTWGRASPWTEAGCRPRSCVGSSVERFGPTSKTSGVSIRPSSMRSPRCIARSRTWNSACSSSRTRAGKAGESDDRGRAGGERAPVRASVRALGESARSADQNPDGSGHGLADGGLRCAGSECGYGGNAIHRSAGVSIDTYQFVAIS